MRRKIVAGNWKMNGGAKFALEYLDSFLPSLSELDCKAEVVLIPPFTQISAMATRLDGAWSVGAQNVSAFDSGAYTGEVSAQMLSELKCDWCLIGHSERRSLFNEQNSEVVEKIKQLLDSGIKPILCVGESLEERESGAAEQVVFSQIDVVLDAFDENVLEQLVVAYEPVWAIGTGRTATPDQAQAMHEAIRGRVAEKYPSLAEGMPILYGGSVNAGNAHALFAQKDIDGGLVGGASLKTTEFLQICEQIG